MPNYWKYKGGGSVDVEYMSTYGIVIIIIIVQKVRYCYTSAIFH